MIFEHEPEVRIMNMCVNSKKDRTTNDKLKGATYEFTSEGIEKNLFPTLTLAREYATEKAFEVRSAVLVSVFNERGEELVYGVARTSLDTTWDEKVSG